MYVREGPTRKGNGREPNIPFRPPPPHLTRRAPQRPLLPPNLTSGRGSERATGSRSPCHLPSARHRAENDIACPADASKASTEACEPKGKHREAPRPGRLPRGTGPAVPALGTSAPRSPARPRLGGRLGRAHPASQTSASPGPPAPPDAAPPALSVAQSAHAGRVRTRPRLLPSPAPRASAPRPVPQRPRAGTEPRFTSWHVASLRNAFYKS